MKYVEGKLYRQYLVTITTYLKKFFKNRIVILI